MTKNRDKIVNRDLKKKKVIFLPYRPPLATPPKSTIVPSSRHFTFMHLADAFIQSDLQCIIHGYTFFISMCVPWELNPQPLRC